jgi:hypothetical protein
MRRFLFVRLNVTGFPFASTVLVLIICFAIEANNSALSLAHVSATNGFGDRRLGDRKD